MITKFQCLNPVDIAKALAFYRKKRQSFNFPVKYHEQCPELLQKVLAYSLVEKREVHQNQKIEQVSGFYLKQITPLIGDEDLSVAMNHMRKSLDDQKSDILNTLHEAEHKSSASLMIILANQEKYGNANAVQSWLLAFFSEGNSYEYPIESVKNIFRGAMEYFENLKDDKRIASLKALFESQYGEISENEYYIIR